MLVIGISGEWQIVSENASEAIARTIDETIVSIPSFLC